jgi:hypothetical protein
LGLNFIQQLLPRAYEKGLLTEGGIPHANRFQQIGACEKKNWQFSKANLKLGNCSNYGSCQSQIFAVV